jgi:hypothetical protein
VKHTTSLSIPGRVTRLFPTLLSGFYKQLPTQPRYQH